MREFGGGLALNLTLPDDQQVPAEAAQFVPLRQVAGPIALELGLPERPACDGHGPAEFAVVAMPEAAMDENDFSVRGEYEIGTARQGAEVETITVAHGVDQPPDNHFGLCVPATNSGHVERALDVSVDVRHLPVLFPSRASGSSLDQGDVRKNARTK